MVVGGRVDAMGSNARLGKSQYLVAEADESDRSFLKLSPIIAVVTNIDREHMDTYRDMEDIEQTFLDFLDRLPFYGMAVICNDDDRVRNLLPRIGRRVVTYGFRQGSDFCVQVSARGGAESDGTARPVNRFSVDYRGKSLGEFQVIVPGTHNIQNAAAAVAVGIGLDIEPDKIRSALALFNGVDRRFELKGKADGVSVVDDYGHHPREIRATLAAARQCGFRHLHVIFQPHRYTRTRDLMDDFAAAFDDADTLRVLDIYPASEPPIPGITGQALVQRISATALKAEYCSSTERAVVEAVKAAKSGDMILTLGAGNISQAGPMLLELLAKRERDTSILAAK